MNTELPPRVDLGAGFLGRPVTLTGLSAFEEVQLGELPERDPFAILDRLAEGLAPGEVVAGFFGYECAAVVHPELDLPPPPLGEPVAWFGRFSAAVPLDLTAEEAPAQLMRTESQPGREHFENQVEEVRRAIAAGDYFQANISRRDTAFFAARTSHLPHRAVSTALSQRFGARIILPSTTVLSASPELFLALEGRNLLSEPIKGTRPRGRSEEEDIKLAQELLSDQKDRAENIMIADLMRNDLAKVCEDHSVAEPVLCAVRSLPHVHHLYSQVTGSLRDGLGFADALRAAFPCGSITGAPKLAAMRAIAAIEGEGRGAYCGSVVTMTRESAVASVAIRTAVLDHVSGRLDARSGGGITWLSDPASEYLETEDKAYLFRLLTGAS
jgi:para-aminobenzoate synthetase/4-amino-4-deoxychorismate lyase